MIKIIALNGSPNKEGNTKILIEEAIKGAKEVCDIDYEIINVNEVLHTSKTYFCTQCSDPCSKVCYKGTELEKVYEKLTKADGIIFGSPSYFGSVSAQLKAFMDKARILRGEKGLYDKVAGGITVGASKYGGQETTMKALHDIMLVQGMIVVGDGYIEDDCGHSGACAQRPAENDEYGLKRARIIGKRVADLASRLN